MRQNLEWKLGFQASLPTLDWVEHGSTSHANSVFMWTTLAVATCGLASVSQGIAILFGKLSTSLTSPANIYSSSTISAAVPGLFVTVAHVMCQQKTRYIFYL